MNWKNQCYIIVKLKRSIFSCPECEVVLSPWVTALPEFVISYFVSVKCPQLFHSATNSIIYLLCARCLGTYSGSIQNRRGEWSFSVLPGEGNPRSDIFTDTARKKFAQRKCVSQDELLRVCRLSWKNSYKGAQGKDPNLVLELQVHWKSCRAKHTPGLRVFTHFERFLHLCKLNIFVSGHLITGL